MRRLLHRAVALAQVNDVAEIVAENLHFDVPRTSDQLFHVHAAVFEARFGFRRGAGVRALQILGRSTTRMPCRRRPPSP